MKSNGAAARADERDQCPVRSCSVAGAEQGGCVGEAKLWVWERGREMRDVHRIAYVLISISIE